MVHYENDFQGILLPTFQLREQRKKIVRNALNVPRTRNGKSGFHKKIVDKAKWSNKTNRMICSTAEAQPVEKYTLLSPRWPVEFDSCLNSIPSCFIGSRR